MQTSLGGNWPICFICSFASFLLFLQPPLGFTSEPPAQKARTRRYCRLEGRSAALISALLYCSDVVWGRSTAMISLLL